MPEEISERTGRAGREERGRGIERKDGEGRGDLIAGIFGGLWAPDGTEGAADPVGPGEKPAADAGSGLLWQQKKRVVAVRQGPCVAGPDQIPDGGLRLSRLRRADNSAGGE